MQYFKHYSNADESDGLNIILDKYGFEGYGRYWRLMEFLSKRFDGSTTDFEVNSRLLRDCLRIRSRLQLNNYLVTIGLLPSINVVIIGEQIFISAPILLELQSRDFKKARTDRAPCARKNKDIDKDKELDKEKENKKEKFLNDLVFERIKKAFKEATGIGSMGNARARLENLILSEEVLANFLKAIENYGKVLEIQKSWRRPKGTLAAFVGSPQGGFSWDDFLDDACVEEARMVDSRKNSVASQIKSKSQQLQDAHQILFDQIRNGEIEA